MRQTLSKRPVRVFAGRLWRAALPLLLALAVTGCAHSPTFNVLGSYFPGWLACIVVGVLVAVLVHVLLSRRDWEGRIAALPLFYLSVTLAVACVCWLLAFE